MQSGQGDIFIMMIYSFSWCGTENSGAIQGESLTIEFC